MRYIYVDEAGTSAHEPVTVVVGVIAHADMHVMAAERALQESMGAVPAQYRDGFIFHATEVFSNESVRDGWSLTDRVNLLKTVMSLPRRLDMALTISVQWRRKSEAALYTSLGIRPEQGDHLEAFKCCLAMSDRGIRSHAHPSEVATVVAEDVSEMRQYLKLAAATLLERPRVIPPEGLRKTSRDEEAGHSVQTNEHRITRIRRAVQFVDKDEEPLIQLADACAFGLRRYFSKQSFGQEFARSITGNENILIHYAAPGGAECYWPNHLRDPSQNLLQ